MTIDLDILWLLAMPTTIMLMVIWLSTQQVRLKLLILCLIAFAAVWFHWFDPWFGFVFAFLFAGVGATLLDRYYPVNQEAYHGPFDR